MSDSSGRNEHNVIPAFCDPVLTGKLLRVLRVTVGALEAIALSRSSTEAVPVGESPGVSASR